MRISDWSSDVCSSDLLGATADDHVGTEGEVQRLSLYLHRQMRRRIDLRFDHRHGLQVAVAVTRLQPEQLELRLNIVHGELLADTARGTATKCIGSQRDTMGTEILG